MDRYFLERNVQTCMRVVLCQRKKGLPSFLALSMKSFECLTSTSSNVVMLYLAFWSPSCMFWTSDMSGNGASGPSSTIRCLPTLPHRGMTVSSSLSVAQQCTRLRGPYFLWKAGSLGKEYQYGSDMASRWYR